MDWANYETSISLRGAFLGGMLNEPPWNNPWIVEQGRRQISKEMGQLDEHLTKYRARTSPAVHSRLLTYRSVSSSTVGSTGRWSRGVPGAVLGDCVGGAGERGGSTH